MSLHLNFAAPDAGKACYLAERWLALAESRLDYLTELFESGRWRRFHTEVEFLENIHEAKANVERWQALVEAATQARKLARSSVLYEAPRPATPRTPASHAKLKRGGAAPVDVSLSPPLQPVDAPRSSDTHVAAAAVTPADLDWQRALDPLTIADRYPMLRTAAM